MFLKSILPDIIIAISSANSSLTICMLHLFPLFYLKFMPLNLKHASDGQHIVGTSSLSILTFSAF